MDRKIYYDEIDSPIGPLTLGWSAAGLCQIDFGTWDSGRERLIRWSAAAHGTDRWERSAELLRPAVQQLEQYFAGQRRDFDLPLDLRGTSFQLQVWQALTQIPYGAVWSYKAVAEHIGSPKAVRAVGGANNRNPLPVVIPCHRVIGAGGSMVGYGGGLDIKTFLLKLEGYPVS